MNPGRVVAELAQLDMNPGRVVAELAQLDMNPGRVVAELPQLDMDLGDVLAESDLAALDDIQPIVDGAERLRLLLEPGGDAGYHANVRSVIGRLPCQNRGEEFSEDLLDRDGEQPEHR